jgi:hypothetical protein
MMNEYSQLTIQQTDSTTKVTGASGRVLALSPASNQGGANASGGGGDDTEGPPVGKWQGTQFVVVAPGFGGGTSTRTYELSPDGKQLYVTTKIENERLSQPVTFRFVYDAAKSGGDSDK